MDTLVPSLWVGFAVHSIGWLVLKRWRSIDAIGYLPLMIAYSRVTEIAASGVARTSWQVTAALLYAVYICITYLVWLHVAPDMNDSASDV
jgi:hypothetical protein